MTGKPRFGDWIRRVFGADRGETHSAAPTIQAGWFEELLASTRFLVRFPQYAGVVARMDPVATTTIPVAAVAVRRVDAPDSRLLLLWNRAYFEAHPEHRVGVLLHEIQHVVCGHLHDASFHRVAYPRLMEVAMEVTANEPIDAKTAELPPHGFDLATFARFGVRRGQSTRERYVVLRAAYEDGRLRPRDIWSPRGFDEHRTRDHDLPASGLGDVLDMRSDLTEEGNWASAPFALSPPSSRATLDRMRIEIAAHLGGERGGRDDATGAGSRMGKELARVVLADGSRGEVDWRRVLRQAFPPKRLVVPDYTRPNRRFVTRVGEIPGRRRRLPKPALVAAIDTSGSMDADTLQRVNRELVRLGAHARVTVVECDAVVHRVYRLGSRPNTLVGGGDTDFAPTFDAVPSPRETDGLVYFTDGKGAMPDVPPAIPTLWALPHDGAFVPEFGSILRIG